MCTSYESLCFACLYKSLKIVSFMFLHFLSALCLSLIALKRSYLIVSYHGEELCLINFYGDDGACLFCMLHKKSQNWFAFLIDED